MNEKIRRSFLFNLVVVLILCAILYILFFTSLRWITHHGEEIKIPDVIGMRMDSAVSRMNSMEFEVFIDSTYIPKEKPFTVLKQIPDSGSIVKRGRTVFITVNKAVPPMTTMPNLVSLSYRSAAMLLRNNKLLLGDTTYRPDIAQDAVLEQKIDGQDVKSGDMIPQGSKIDLVLGDGLGTTEFNVPDVVGMPYDEGVATLMGNSLQYTAIWDGDITDSTTAIIYDQAPRAMNAMQGHNQIKAGDIVDIRIKQNPTREEMDHNRNNGQGVNNSGDKDNNDGAHYDPNFKP